MVSVCLFILGTRRHATLPAAKSRPNPIASTTANPAAPSSSCKRGMPRNASSCLTKLSRTGIWTDARHTFRSMHCFGIPTPRSSLKCRRSRPSRPAGCSTQTCVLIVFLFVCLFGANGKCANGKCTYAQMLKMLKTSNAQIPNAKMHKCPNAQTPNAQTPNAQTPNAQMPNAQTPNGQTPNAKCSNALMLNARLSPLLLYYSLHPHTQVTIDGLALDENLPLNVLIPVLLNICWVIAQICLTSAQERVAKRMERRGGVLLTMVHFGDGWCLRI